MIEYRQDWPHGQPWKELCQYVRTDQIRTNVYDHRINGVVYLASDKDKTKMLEAFEKEMTWMRLQWPR